MADDLRLLVIQGETQVCSALFNQLEITDPPAVPPSLDNSVYSPQKRIDGSL